MMKIKSVDKLKPTNQCNQILSAIQNEVSNLSEKKAVGEKRTMFYGFFIGQS